jgi:hypothetical protein
MSSDVETSLELLTHMLLKNQLEIPHCVRNDRNPAAAVLVFFSLRQGHGFECAALLDRVRRNLELVAVGIAEINRVRDFVILEFEFDSALF